MGGAGPGAGAGPQQPARHPPVNGAKRPLAAASALTSLLRSTEQLPAMSTSLDFDARSALSVSLYPSTYFPARGQREGTGGGGGGGEVAAPAPQAAAARPSARAARARALHAQCSAMRAAKHAQPWPRRLCAVAQSGPQRQGEETTPPPPHTRRGEFHALGCYFTHRSSSPSAASG